MGRLIDADAFETNLRKLDCESNNQDYRDGAADMLKAVYTILNIQPTAYDVEKVVAELEKEKEIHTEHYNISLYKDYPEIKQRYEQMQRVIDKAIEIVRKGGTE